MIMIKDDDVELGNEREREREGERKARKLYGMPHTDTHTNSVYYDYRVILRSVGNLYVNHMHELGPFLFAFPTLTSGRRFSLPTCHSIIFALIKQPAYLFVSSSRHV